MKHSIKETMPKIKTWNLWNLWKSKNLWKKSSFEDTPENENMHQQEKKKKIF